MEMNLGLNSYVLVAGSSPTRNGSTSGGRRVTCDLEAAKHRADDATDRQRAPAAVRQARAAERQTRETSSTLGPAKLEPSWPGL